jgi:hypothetical protein
MLLFSRHPFAVRIDVGVSSENPRHWVQGQLPASRATIRVAHGNARTPGQRTDVPIGADRCRSDGWRQLRSGALVCVIVALTVNVSYACRRSARLTA